MKINSLTIEGFRSFAKSQTWLPCVSGPGLYHLTGRNEAEPNLEANGAGKSSLYEALFWVFFGRTSRGLKAGSIQCWLSNSPKCRVTVDFEHASDRWLLSRTWNPNNLTLSTPDNPDRPVDQQEVERRIGVGPEAFLQAIYFAQFTPAFVDLTPADRLSLFSEVLNLEKWERASSRASAQVKALEVKRTALEQSRASNEGELRGLNTEELFDREGVWAEEQETKIESARQAKSDVLEELARKRRTVSIMDRSAEAAPPTVEQVSVAELRTELAKQEAAVRRTSVLLQDKRATAGAITREKKRLKDLTPGSKCPICTQPLESAHLEKELLQLTKELYSAEAEVEVALLAAQQTTDITAALRTEIELKKQAENEQALATERLRSSRALAEAAVRQVEAAVERAETALHGTLQETNPHTAALERALSRRKTLTAECEELVGLLTDASQLSTAFGYWAKGFKDLRLFVVQRVLAQLEIETTNTLVALGLSAWSVKFTVEQETKSGTLKRGLSVLVRAPGAPDAVPFEAWSGGESQRLRLAVSMGLSGLISGQLGLDCNIQIWDEPTTWMSDAGIAELLDVLRERAATTGKAFWLADHRSLDYGGFAGGLCAVKTAAGTILESAISANSPGEAPGAVLGADPSPIPTLRRKTAARAE